MATDVILPALGMAQDTGKIVQWLKAEGEMVTKGEPLVEIETDKATVEVEAPADGILARVSATAGAEVPVGEVIAMLLAPDETSLQNAGPGASPKARRLAAEQGKDLSEIKGSGPNGAVLAADVLAVLTPMIAPVEAVAEHRTLPEPAISEEQSLTPGTIWQRMAERTTQSWTTVPHFSLVREVNASRLIAWREHILQQDKEKVTYTDLLTKLVATTLLAYPRLNASWQDGKIVLQREIHIGLAAAIPAGLIVPVLHQTNTLTLHQIIRQRKELVAKAQAGKLQLRDINGGTFTISNLGMYDIDAFNAIINQPQAAILAVGRIAERVVPLNGQPAVQPMMVLTLSCDHRVIDGAGAAQFLRALASLIEEPLGLLDTL